MFAYVGSYTTPDRNGRGNGINVYRVNPISGGWSPIQTVGYLENPSFFTTKPRWLPSLLRTRRPSLDQRFRHRPANRDTDVAQPSRLSGQ